VLISSEFADIIGLKHCKLFKLFSVSGAFVERERKLDSVTVLDEYCKVHLQLWKSRMVNAVICPTLHTDLILGLNFLMKNKIVVDAELRTAIVKDSNYNLLNTPTATPRKLSLSPHQQ
jgi:hypothetical protein